MYRHTFEVCLIDYRDLRLRHLVPAFILLGRIRCALHVVVLVICRRSWDAVQ